MTTAKKLRKVVEELNAIAGHLEEIGFQAQSDVVGGALEQLEELAQDFEEL